jgi:two-component system, NtrC family, sensor kinase
MGFGHWCVSNSVPIERPALRFLGNSLRLNILAHLTLLIVAAMMLTGIVMLKFEERDLIQGKLQIGYLLSRSLRQTIGDKLTRPGGKVDASPPLSSRRREILSLIQSAGFAGAALVDRQGIALFTSLPDGEETRMGLAAARHSLITGQTAVRFSGQTWGVLWPAHDKVTITVPVTEQKGLLGSIAVWSDLRPVYRKIRRSEKLILIYILLNTLVLISVGLYLLSRTVVNPVNRLLRLTETFEEGESLPLFPDVSENEIGQLNRALNLMLTRLDENKKELQAHILSLEQANAEIRKTQEELIMSEKLASVGRLATGIAHEIGNPMGIILGYMDLLKRGDLSPDERRDFLERAESEITRISDIIRQLLDFSRPAGGERDRVRLHELLHATIRILKPQPLMSNIQLDIAFDASRDTIWADPNQVQQVFLNIMMNAADAMSKEKRLTIETSNTEDTIRIRFKDTGSGIPEEDLGRIFDPFYTTKPPGKGTGLGLSVSHTIVRNLGGIIRAENNRGPGATLTIEMPLCSEGEDSCRRNGS